VLYWKLRREINWKYYPLLLIGCEIIEVNDTNITLIQGLFKNILFYGILM
jgi:hypothetical protein